jgi:hypothetical protein
METILPIKTKINNAKEPNDVHKNILKEDILQVITENFMDMILDKRHSRNSKTMKTKDTRRHRNK